MFATGDFPPLSDAVGIAIYRGPRKSTADFRMGREMPKFVIENSDVLAILRIISGNSAKLRPFLLLRPYYSLEMALFPL